MRPPALALFAAVVAAPAFGDLVEFEWTGDLNQVRAVGSLSGFDNQVVDGLLKSDDNELTAFAITFFRVSDDTVVASYDLADLLAAGNVNVAIAAATVAILANGNAFETGPTFYGFSIGDNATGTLFSQRDAPFFTYTDNDSGPFPGVPLVDSGGTLEVTYSERVPVPATLWLLGLGGLALAGARRARTASLMR